MRVRPLTRDRLVEELTSAVDARPRDRWCRVLVDGSPPTRPGEWAEALTAPLRLAGREVVHVRAGDYLRPASLRYENGRDDPDVMYDEWLDVGALVREVLAPLEPGGTGQVLPALWDTATDRAFRSDRVQILPAGVVLVSGSLLLGRSLPVDVSVHLALSRGALARMTASSQQWTLAAYDRYEREVAPRQAADHVVLLDNPDRPALVDAH